MSDHKKVIDVKGKWVEWFNGKKKFIINIDQLVDIPEGYTINYVDTTPQPIKVSYNKIAPKYKL